MEISSIVKARWDYFTHMTRMLNVILPTLIMINVYNTGPDALSSTYFWTIQSWAAICIWVRFILFLGTLDKFAVLTRLIIQSFSDMGPFLVIFFLGVFAFADAFLSVDKIMFMNGKKEQALVGNDADIYDLYLVDYVTAIKNSFLTAFGGFDEQLLDYRNADWLVFLMCVMFNVIVLLNLLIAIVSQTFADVND